MIPKSFIKKFFIGTAALFITGVAALLFVVYSSYSTQGVNLHQINYFIEQQAQTIASDFAAIQKSIDSAQVWETQVQPQSSHVYVYKNRKLALWSQHYFVPPFENHEKDTVVFKNYHTGKFILIQHFYTKGNDTYHLMGLIPVYKKYAVKTQYLSSTYALEYLNRQVDKISVQPNGVNDVYLHGKFIFSVEAKQKVEAIPFTVLKTIIIILLYLILVAWGVVLAIWFLYKFSKWKVLTAASVFTVVILLIPIKQPLYLLEHIPPPLVQIIKNAIVLLAFGSFAAIVVANIRIKNVSFLRKVPVLWLLAGVGLQSLLAVYILNQTSYFTTLPDYSIEFSHLQLFKPQKTVSFLLYIIYAGIFLLYVHIVTKPVAFAVNRRIPHLTYGALIVGLFIWMLGEPGHKYWQVPLATCYVLLSILCLFFWPEVWRRLVYITYIYLFIGIIFFAFLIAWVNRSVVLEQQNKLMAKVAAKVNNEAEYIDFSKMQAIADSISHDPLISDIFVNPFASVETAEQKVIKYYVGDYFEKFECNVYFFNTAGYCLNKTVKRSYFDYYKQYNQPKYRTKYKNLFQINSPAKVYYKFSEIKDGQQAIGYFTLEFTARRTLPNSIFPKLFLEKDVYMYEWDEQPAFGVYKGNVLVSSSGKFNFAQNIPTVYPQSFSNENKEVFVSGYRCKRFTFTDSKSIIVALPDYQTKRLFSNFGLLFFTFAFFLLIFILTNTIYTKLRQSHAAFATKIQLYLNIAFVVPLAIVSITAFTVIIGHHQAELDQNFINRAEGISQSLSEWMSQYQKNSLKTEDINSRLEAISRVTQTDLLVYQPNGKFLAGTEPKIFELNLLSEYVNPQAFKALVYYKQNHFLAAESIGTLPFKTVYYAIKNIDNGDFMGFLAIPYFDSGKEISSRINDAFSTILNVFTLLFIGFLALSFFASKLLIAPLTMLTNRLKHTRLEAMNTPLPYAANDEIGLLVNAYNTMLNKLEESKKILAANEKETAWREMAKQVAHEIKNPLTPIKLTLQNLLRLKKDNQLSKEEINNYENAAIKTVLTHIDLLSEIATSFSAFAQMPIPIMESCYIAHILEDIDLLYRSYPQVKVAQPTTCRDVKILADRKLLIRIFTNLITNALEATNETENARIEVNVHCNETYFIFKISDNGHGILPENRNKIFEPNFSTKKGGSGIGLAVAKRGIELMGGSIQFNNEPITTFTVTLPICH